MVDVLVRGLSARIVARLKARAAGNGRSLQSEAKEILVSAAGYTPREAMAVARKWQQKLAGRSMRDSVHLIRADRER